MEQETIVKSVNNIAWKQAEIDENHARIIAQKYSLPEVIARNLAIREVPIQEVEAYLSPTLKTFLPDPFHLKDMDKGVERIIKAIMNNENIVIFGDYDVDGATSSSLLTLFFKGLGIETKTYIPDRMKEGYGPNAGAFTALKNDGADVVITVDCGVSAFEPLLHAKNIGLDVIVIDHHMSSETLPEAVAIINPNRVDETSEYKYLAAVGVAFLFAVAIKSKLKINNFFVNKIEPDLLSLLDIVALGTVCDVVPLVKLNRAFVVQGIKVINKKSNLGLKVLSDVACINGDLGVYHLGYILGPRINAGGRVGESYLGTYLLTSKKLQQAENLAMKLDMFNHERKAIEALILDEALIQAEQLDANNDLLVLVGENWHIGVIGIIASRVKERFNKPVAVLSIEGNEAKASCRSVKGFDFGAAIISAKQEGLLVAGGGHAMAAGFTVYKDNIDTLKQYLIEKYQAASNDVLNHSVRYYESTITPGAITTNIAKLIAQAGPYGAGNNEPRFLIKEAMIVNTQVFSQAHIRCLIKSSNFYDHNITIKAMAFNALNSPLGQVLLENQGKEINIIGYIKLNKWQEKENAEIVIDDVLI